MDLTRRQKQLLDCVKQLLAETEKYPTLKEIANCMGISSVSSVHTHISKLKEKGVNLFQVENTNEETSKNVTIPLFGFVVAGTPTDVCDFYENIEVPSSLVPNPNKTYALKITGNSMIEEHICDGDIVIVEKTPYAKCGDIVIALVNNTETTVKRFKQEGDYVFLIPANKEMETLKLPSWQVQIQGVVVGVFRKYK